MKTKLTFKLLGCCILLSGMMPPVHAQTAPSLTFSQFVPAVAELSWPGNYTNWQLMSTTDLGIPAAWQPVAGTPLPLGQQPRDVLSADQCNLFLPVAAEYRRRRGK